MPPASVQVQQASLAAGLRRLLGPALGEQGRPDPVAALAGLAVVAQDQAVDRPGDQSGRGQVQAEHVAVGLGVAAQAQRQHRLGIERVQLELD